MGIVGKLVTVLGADTSGLRKGLKESEGLINSTVNRLNSMKGELLSIGAMAMPVKAVQDWAAAINDLEDKTDMTGETASRLLSIGEYVGLSTDLMSNCMARMSKSAYTAAKSIEAAAASGSVSNDVYTKFGIQIMDTNGHLLSAEQILANVTEKHRNMANGVEKTAMEMEIFGRSGANLNDLLNLSQETFDEVYASAERAGLVLSHDTTQAFEDAGFEVNAAKQAMKGLMVSIGAEMLPAVQKLSRGVKDVSEAFAALSPEQRHAAATALEVAAAVSAVSIAMRGMKYIVGPYMSYISKLISGYGALKVAAGSAAAAMAMVAAVATIAVAVYSGAKEKFDNAEAGGGFDYDEDTGQVFVKGQNPYRTDEENAALKKENDEAIAAKMQEKAEESARKMRESAEASMESFMKPGELNFSGIGGGGIGGGSTGGASDMTAEVNRLNEAIGEAEQRGASLRANFEDWKVYVDFEGLDGAAKVYAELDQREQQRYKAAEDYLRQYTDARQEAEKLVESARAAGDEGVLSNALALLDTRKAAEAQAAEDIAAKKIEISEQMEKERNSVATRAMALRQDMEAARVEGDVAAYMQALDDKNAAFLGNLEEQQSLMDAYYQWRMEAEQSYMDFALEAADTLKNSLASGIADSIVNGNKLADVFKNVGKQIVQMFIQWQIKQALSATFAKALRKKELADTTIAAAAASKALATPAWLKLVVNPGAGPVATGLLTEGIATAPALAFASGGVITAPTFALMGEGKDNEAVIPLRKGIFAHLLGIDEDQRQGQSVNIAQNIYGDINDGGDTDDMFRQFSEMVSEGIRGA